MPDGDDINKILEEGLVEPIEFITPPGSSQIVLEVNPAWRAPMPRLEGQEEVREIELTRRNYGPLELIHIDDIPEPPKARTGFKCKHPSSFTSWSDDGRWCAKCETMIAGPR